MQSFKIALLPVFSSATTESGTSELVLSNGYQVYTVNGLGGGITTPFNVKQYLDNVNNLSVATSFFNFLQLNTTQSQFREVFYDINKLSVAFNDFYYSVVVTNKLPTNTVIKSEINATSAITYINNTVFVDQNTRASNLITTSVGYATGQSYYINVCITLNKNEALQDDFSSYTANAIGASGQVLLNGFVDYNFDDNESEYWTNI